MTELVRGSCAVLSMMVAGWSLGRVPAQNLVQKRLAMLALSAYAGAAAIQQFSLFHSPLTTRTVFTVAAVLVGSVYVVVGFTHERKGSR